MKMRKKINLIVSSRGQLTLPAEIRKRYGIGEGSVLMAEDRNGEIILKPAIVVESELYDDRQINEWIAQDSVTESDKAAIRSKIKKVSERKRRYR